MTQTSTTHEGSGIDLAGLDEAIRPQDDLYRHVNGRWIDRHEIPADRAMDGAFRALFDAAEVHVREIIEDAGAAVRSGTGTGVQAKVGALFASFMDAATIEERGIGPIAAEIDALRAADSAAAMTEALGALQRTGGAGAVGLYVDNDDKAPDRYVVHLCQGGLGLPDEAYYREDQYAQLRATYQGHIDRMLALLGHGSPGAGARVLALETRLAGHHWDVVRDRDADLTYNPMTLAELAAAAPGFDWRVWIDALGAPDGAFDRVIVREPGFVAGFAAMWASEPVDDWRDWALYHLATARAPYLCDELVEANFDFYGRTLSGAQEVRERWKRGVSLVEGALGEAVGEEYVARHFPPEHKARMEDLVANLVAAYRASIAGLDWMTEATKAKALAKLDAFTPKIGYPATWRDYSALVIEPDDLAGNVRRSYAFDLDRELAKIGKPIDRDEWFMTPQTVNAYYNPGMNEIVFPAAILQPPFFTPSAEDAVNYGGIGAVIGHEIGHGFDDQGSKYDGDGLLDDWWTAEDRSEFEQRTRALIAQYDALRPRQLPADAPHVNGALTIGENIGDLGGLAIAIQAYRIALGGDLAAAPVIDGLTGLQRVFVGWGQVWQSKGRDEEVLRRLATDPHSPNEFRCNAVVRNVDEFYAAFDLQPGDALYLPAEERVKIW